jgi:hypothetical protein
MMLARKTQICLFVVVVLTSSVQLLGQAVNGTLLGTVSDPTGAVVGSAKISAVQTETGAIRETVKPRWKLVSTHSS